MLAAVGLVQTRRDFVRSLEAIACRLRGARCWFEFNAASCGFAVQLRSRCGPDESQAQSPPLALAFVCHADLLASG
eukprot:3230690-Rhodomonas_salina.1